LESSNFNDWALLKELKNLEIINLNKTAATNETIKVLSTMDQLKHVSFAYTQVTDIRPLVVLNKLQRLNAGITNIPFENYPEFTVDAIISPPNEFDSRQDDAPQYIKDMVARTLKKYRECKETQACIEPPW
jgi:hypothetical protein